VCPSIVVVPYCVFGICDAAPYLVTQVIDLIGHAIREGVIARASSHADTQGSTSFCALNGATNYSKIIHCFTPN
jgi:hypothetical protein